LKLLLLALLFLQNAYALNFHMVENLVSTHQKILNKYQDEMNTDAFSLDRFDLQLGIGMGGDIGVVSAGGSAAVELIWTREKLRVQQTERMVYLHLSDDEVMIANQILNTLSHDIDMQRMKRKYKRKLFKLLLSDAHVMKKIFHSKMKLGEAFYLEGFQLSYLFSAGLDILRVVNANVSKRIRLRFKLTSTPLSHEKKTDFELIDPALKKVEDKISLMDQHPDFELSRIWINAETSSSLTALIVKLNASRNLQLDFRRIQRTIPYQFESSQNALSKISTTLLERIRPYDEEDFKLSQVRLKMNFDISGDLWLVAMSQDVGVQFHYFRRTL
jgi:hypothetical protein